MSMGEISYRQKLCSESEILVQEIFREMVQALPAGAVRSFHRRNDLNDSLASLE